MVAATLSREVSAPVSTLVLCTPSWIPLGAHNRGARETLGVIAAHIARHDKTVLVLDEIDKLISGPGGVTGTSGGGGDSWQSYVRAELYTAVLDCRWPAGFHPPEMDDGTEVNIGELERKLKNTVFVVGIGTFQNWFDAAGSRRTMGFTAEDNTANEAITADIVAVNMPRELSNRFNSNLIRLPELTPDDYRRISNEAENQLPERMRDEFRRAVTRLMPGAIAAKKGCRFLEEAMLETLMNLPPETAASIAMTSANESQIEADPGICIL